MGQALIFSGAVQEGVSACSDERNDLERLPCEAIGYDKLNDRATAEASYQELIDKYGDAGAYQQAQVLAQWGDLEKALEVLDLAVELGDSGLTFAYTDPALDSLRDTNKFQAMLEKIGFVG